MESLELLLVALGCLVGAVLQSATGFGYALVAGPAAFSAMQPAEAVTTMIALSSILNAMTLFGEGRRGAVRRGELVPVLGWAAPGVAAGIAILVVLSKAELQVIVGVCVLAAVAVLARRGHAEGRGTSPGARAAAGIAAGTLTTSTATSGPPLVLLLRSSGASAAEVRDTIAAMFLGLNAMGAAALVVAGNKARLPQLEILGLLIVLAILGLLLGRLVFERLDEAAFRLAGSLVIVASGVASIVSGLV